MRRGVTYILVLILLIGLLSSLGSVSANSKPEVLNPKIVPAIPTTQEDLTATYEVDDPDGDDIEDIEITWYKNGILQSSFDDLENIPSNATAKGENWYYSIRVSDGMNYSDTNQSDIIFIANSPPYILNFSPVITPIFINETENIDFFVQVEDPDGDYIMYNWTIDGITVNDSDYFIFETDFESAGIYILNLTIQDVGEDSYTLSYGWVIAVFNVNRRPQVTINEPEVQNPTMNEGDSLRFQINANDLDPEDTLQITWFVDDVLAQSGGTSYTFNADFTSSRERVVTVVVDDGTDNIEYSWNLTVEDVASDTNADSEPSSDDIRLYSIIFLIVVVVTIILVLILVFSIMKKSNK
jgi:hypothetical protein